MFHLYNIMISVLHVCERTPWALLKYCSGNSEESMNKLRAAVATASSAKAAELEKLLAELQKVQMNIITTLLHEQCLHFNVGIQLV